MFFFFKSFRPLEFQNGFMIVEEIDENDQVVQTVRIAASFDMGWSQRSNGYTYDSLNGYCCLLGLKTGKVLGYRCYYNRKCLQCDVDFKLKQKVDHDCRLTWHGTDKAMEAQGAAGLVQNAITTHKILKQADMNHTTKGVSKKLYEIAKSSSQNPDDEMLHDFINYLKKCFTSGVKQNRGNLEKMKNAITNIPKHVFDDHQHCGNWCKAEKENYSRSYDVNNPILFDSLSNLFNDLQESAANFVMAGSSQANESLNNSMCSKAPKRVCFSRLASADRRYTCTVNQKNLGEKYILNVLDGLNITWNQDLENYFNKLFDLALNHYKKLILPAYKKRRIENRQARTQLRNRTEAAEGQKL